MKILVGTYTHQDSEGLYSIKLDKKKKKLEGLALVAKQLSPTYISISESGNIYLAIEDYGDGGVCGLNPDYKKINSVTDKDEPLCYISIDEKRHLIYGACYPRGEVFVYKLQSDGSMGLVDTLVHHDKLGPHKNQNTQHAHFINLTPDGRVVVCDLGTDILYTYNISNEGHLSEIARFHANSGSGPRHIVFNPNGEYAYLLDELDNTITVLKYDSSNGNFKLQQRILTIPDDYYEVSAAAAIRISGDGNYLYASNRGHNSIVNYEIMDKGAKLMPIQWISTEGKNPRDFSLDSSDKFLVVANQDSNNLTLFSRSIISGKLTMIQKNVYAPECVCVCFDNAE